jgi:hypothetical protein
MYYGQLLDLIESRNLLVIDFHTVVSELNATLQAIGAWYPSVFHVMEITEELEAQTNRKIRELPWGENPLSVSLPDAKRAPWVQRLKDEFRDASGSACLRRIDGIYDRVMSSSALLRLPSDAGRRSVANAS